MTTKTWTNTFFYNGEELGRGIWNFAKYNQTNDTVVDSQVEVIDLTGPVAGQQYVSISGLGPQNHTVNLTANIIDMSDNQAFWLPKMWGYQFNNESLWIEENMTDVEDISKAEIGYVFKSGNVTVVVNCSISDDYSLTCPDRTFECGNFTVRYNVTSSLENYQETYMTQVSNNQAQGIVLHDTTIYEVDKI